MTQIPLKADTDFNWQQNQFVGLREDPGFYNFIFAPTKIPIVLALSETTCEHVAVSPETAMGCHRIRFLQAEEGYYCTFSLNNKYLYQIELRYSLNQLRSQIKDFSCLTLNWEFTSKLIFNSYLTLAFTYLSKSSKHNRNHIKETQHKI